MFQTPFEKTLNDWFCFRFIANNQWFLGSIQFFSLILFVWWYNILIMFVNSENHNIPNHAMIRLRRFYLKSIFTAWSSISLGSWSSFWSRDRWCGYASKIEGELGIAWAMGWIKLPSIGILQQDQIYIIGETLFAGYRDSLSRKLPACHSATRSWKMKGAKFIYKGINRLIVLIKLITSMKFSNIARHYQPLDSSPVPGHSNE